jgi:hypothetical protein
MIMNGLLSMGATTAWVACLAKKRIASSVLTWPRVMLVSLYIWEDTGSNPIDGPPVRTSSWTPVFLPSTTIGPLTRFCSVSIVGLGPSMW